MRLVLASNNASKLAELKALFAELDVDLVAQRELAIGEAEEPYRTFVENALAKARHAAAAARCAAVADDSGLCVDALHGAPGVASAHFAPAQAPQAGDREARRRAQDAANNERLLRELSGVTDRRAHYVCTLVALREEEDPQPLVAVGRWAGEIVHEPRGAGGFGYDPLVRIAEFGCTVAEMAPELKNAHSHRSIAAIQRSTMLREVWRL
jgi:XTP/dITP diphosphohydrolase